MRGGGCKTENERAVGESFKEAKRESARWGNGRAECDGEELLMFSCETCHVKKQNNRGRIITRISEKTSSFHAHPNNTHAPTCDWDTTKPNTLKPTAPVAHTRTACALSSAADYISDKIITEIENEKWLMRRLPPILLLILTVLETGRKTSRAMIYQWLSRTVVLQ